VNRRKLKDFGSGRKKHVLKSRGSLQGGGGGRSSPEKPDSKGGRREGAIGHIPGGKELANTEKKKKGTRGKDIGKAGQKTKTEKKDARSTTGGKRRGEPEREPFFQREALERKWGRLRGQMKVENNYLTGERERTAEGNRGPRKRGKSKLTRGCTRVWTGLGEPFANQGQKAKKKNIRNVHKTSGHLLTPPLEERVMKEPWTTNQEGGFSDVGKYLVHSKKRVSGRGGEVTPQKMPRNPNRAEKKRPGVTEKTGLGDVGDGARQLKGGSLKENTLPNKEKLMLEGSLQERTGQRSVKIRKHFQGGEYDNAGNEMRGKNWTRGKRTRKSPRSGM